MVWVLSYAHGTGKQSDTPLLASTNACSNATQKPEGLVWRICREVLGRWGPGLCALTSSLCFYNEVKAQAVPYSMRGLIVGPTAHGLLRQI